MEFKVPAGIQKNQVYLTPSASASASASSNYTNFSDQAMEGGGAVDMREVIQRELEMEMIREKIIAEEVERFQVLEEQVRRELMLGRQMMAMKITKESQPGDQSKETTNSLLKVCMGNLNGPTLPEDKLKPPPSSLPAAGGSSELNSCNSKKTEWRCSICKISASCERGLLEHLAGKKHHVKAASIVITNSPKCVPNLINKMEWRCPICEVSAPCERGLQDHLAGKKHQAKVEAINSSECVSNDSMEVLKKKLEWKCPICEICSTSEIDLKMHLAGKKHMKARVKLAIIRRGKYI